MIFTYDLRRQPASFNFIHWLSVAYANGVTKVLLKNADNPKKKGWSDAESKERINSIVIGALDYFDIPYEFAEEGGVQLGHHPRDNIKCWEQGIYKPLPVKWRERGDYVTFTMRNMHRQASRNSSRAFRQFAEDHNCVIVEDYLDKPITLKERMDLYSGAKCNFFTSGGCFAIAWLTELPYRAFSFINSGSAKARILRDEEGIRKGWQAPWRVANQAFVWEDETYTNINQEYSMLDWREPVE